MLASVMAAAIFSAPVPVMEYDWFSGIYDWPNKGVKQTELVNIAVNVTINPYGYMQGCTSRVRSGTPELGPYVCSRLGARAEFNPAHDPNGHHMYGIYRTSVVLWTGDSPPPKSFDASDFTITNTAGITPPEGNAFVIQFAVDPHGNSSSCSLVPTVGYGLYRRKQQVDPALVSQACTELPTKMRPEPARDRKGLAVPSVQTANVSLSVPKR